MDPICLFVAGALRASIPDVEFTLTWVHTVQKTRWEERYRRDGDHLLLVEARVESSGAGMEPSPTAVLRNGAWTWRPQTSLPELRLTYSHFARDYELCWRDRCAELGTLLGESANGDVAVVRPCTG